MDFGRPDQSGGGLDLNEAKGHLLLIYPLENVTRPTKYGEKPAVRSNVVDITAGEEIDDVLFFAKVLVDNLKSHVGAGPVLGRLGQGESRNGNNPPWILEDYTDADAAEATAYLAKTGDAPKASAPQPNVDATTGEILDEDAEDIEALEEQIRAKREKLLADKLGAQKVTR